MTENQMSTPHSRHGWRAIVFLVIRWIVPGGIIAAFVFTGHLGDALRSLSDVSLRWSLPLLLVGIALPVSHAWRWRLLLRRAGGEIALAAAVSITALASLINYAAPGFLGAPAKAILARNQHQIPVSRSLPTLAVEQLLDAVLLLAAGVISALLVGPTIVDGVSGTRFASQWPLALMLMSFAIVACVAALFLLRRFLPGFAAAVSEASVMLARSRESQRSILALTGVRWALDMAAVWLASLAIGLRLGLSEVLLIANVSLLAGMLAPVPGGLGVREAVMAAIAGTIGVSIPAVLALSVMHRAGLGLGLPVVLVAARGIDWMRR